MVDQMDSLALSESSLGGNSQKVFFIRKNATGFGNANDVVRRTFAFLRPKSILWLDPPEKNPIIFLIGS